MAGTLLATSILPAGAVASSHDKQGPQDTFGGLILGLIIFLTILGLVVRGHSTSRVHVLVGKRSRGELHAKAGRLATQRRVSGARNFGILLFTVFFLFFTHTSVAERNSVARDHGRGMPSDTDISINFSIDKNYNMYIFKNQESNFIKFDFWQYNLPHHCPPADLPYLPARSQEFARYICSAGVSPPNINYISKNMDTNFYKIGLNDSGTPDGHLFYNVQGQIDKPGQKVHKDDWFYKMKINLLDLLQIRPPYPPNSPVRRVPDHVAYRGVSKWR